MVHIEHILKKEFLNLNKRGMHNSIFKNGQKIWTDTSFKKMCRWQISIWKDALRHVSLEKCRFEPRDATLPADGHSPERWQQQMLAKKEKPQFPFIAGEDEKGPATLGNNLAVYYQLNTPNHHSPQHLPKELKTPVPRKTCIETLLCACWSLGRVRLFVTPWAVAHRAPMPMGFSRQESWSE